MKKSRAIGEMGEIEVRGTEEAPPQPTQRASLGDQIKGLEEATELRKTGVGTTRKQTEALARAPKRVTIARKARRTI